MLLRRSTLAERSLDRPNRRSLHVQPTPRIGGMAMLSAVAITLAILRPGHLPLVLLLAAAILALVSVLDDRAHLPVTLRLPVHVAAATLLALSWLKAYADIATAGHAEIMFAWLTSPYTAFAVILAICWMTNLFNFMDGADGLAGGMAVIGFGGYAIAAALHPMGPSLATVAAAVSGAALGFLFFNFPAGRVFMGDAGSIPIGFMAAAMDIQGSLMGLWPWWFGVLAFSPFIVDATVTLLKRILRRQRIWEAHREHYYQRLILSGWSHRKTVLSYYFLMLGSTGSALAAQNSHLLYPIFGGWVITYMALLLYLEWRFYQHQKDQTEDTPGVK